MITTTTATTRGRARGRGIVALSVTKPPELGGNIPNGEAGLRIEDGINFPALACCNGHKRLVTCLSPGPHIFASLLKNSPQCIGGLLVQAMQRIAMHVVSHLGLVDVACPCLFCKPKHLVCYLHNNSCSHNQNTTIHLSWSQDKSFIIYKYRIPKGGDFHTPILSVCTFLLFFYLGK